MTSHLEGVRKQICENIWTQRAQGAKREMDGHNYRAKCFVICILQRYITVTELRGMRRAELAACSKEMRNTYKILAKNSEGKRPLGGLMRM
jgi:hypothetical protein